MNILVISDSHGDTKPVRHLLETYHGQVEAVIHLGDHAQDMTPFALQYQKNFATHIVNGNNTMPLDGCGDRLVTIGGRRFFITHGHRYQVKSSLDRLIYHVHDIGAEVCLFGHTHVPAMFYDKAVLFMNPGSLSIPYPGESPSYGLLRIDESGDISGKLMDYKTN